MSEHVKKFIDDLQNGKNADAGEAFKDALRAKVADGLDKQRVDIASRIFNDKSTEAQDFSDPKPAVTDPSPETETMMDTQGNEIAFGILDFSTDSVAANRYCCAKETDNPIVKLARQNNEKLFIKIA